MPDYGIQVFNSNGNIQIDNTYASSLTVVDSGTISQGGTLTGVNLQDEVFFHKPSSENSSNTGGSYGGQTIPEGHKLLGRWSGTETSATWNHFASSTSDMAYIRAKLNKDRTEDATSGNAKGLQVQNSSGQRSYSSRYSKNGNIILTLTSVTGIGSGTSGLHFGPPTGVGASSHTWMDLRTYSGNPQQTVAVEQIWNGGNNSISNYYMHFLPMRYQGSYYQYSMWDYTNNKIGVSCMTKFQISSQFGQIWAVFCMPPGGVIMLMKPEG